MQSKRQKAIQIKYKNKPFKVQSIVFEKMIKIKNKKGKITGYQGRWVKEGKGIDGRKTGGFEKWIFGNVETLRPYWNQTKAKAWLKKNHYHIKKVDVTPDTYRFRQANPKHFIQSTYRTKNIGKGISLILAKPEDRNYEKEYAKFQKSKKAKKYRAELNRYNHKKGTYGNGDGLDASHKKGKIVGFEPSHKNKGRIEKSRKKR